MNTTSLLLGAAAGSAVMFLLDPNGGRRRRALMRDRVIRGTRKTRNGLGATSRDLVNRTGGVASVARRRWSAEPVSDVKLVERVRAKLGRACSHPRAIGVDAHDGHITLRGPILSAELNAVLAAAASVRGVSSVDNKLDPHQTAEGIPSLQGDGRIAGPSLDILQPTWAPATRAMVSVGLLASAVCIAATARRGAVGREYGYPDR
jgi:hypothetical protein